MTPLAIVETATGLNVTFSNLDPRKDHTIMIYAGLGFTFVDAVMQKPPFASALLLSDPVGRPDIAEIPTVVTPNFIGYLMPAVAGAAAASSSQFTVAAGALRRSDTTFNRPTTFSVTFGFVPEISFTDGVDVDAEAAGGGAPAWFSAANATARNGTVTMTVWSPVTALRTANVTQWAADGAFYAGDPLVPLADRMPGGLRVVAGDAVVAVNSPNATGNTLSITLDVTRLPPGQYPISLTDGLLRDGASALRSTRVTAWLKIGPVPAWRVRDAASGADVTREPLDAGRALALALVLDGAAAAPATLAGFVASAAQGDATALPAWPSLVDAPSFAALDPFVVAAPAAAGGEAALELRYALAPGAGAGLAPGNYSVALAASGAVCNGLGGRARVCTAREAAPLVLVLGFRPAAGVFDAARALAYGGALDADGAGPASAADAPVPCLAGTLALVFSNAATTAGAIPGGLSLDAVAWAAAVAAPPGLPPPDAVATAAGSLVYSWGNQSVPRIPSGVYDVELRAGVFASAGGVWNARALVRLIVGFDVRLMSAATTVLASGADSPASAPLFRRGAAGPFVVAASDAVLRVAGMLETALSWHDLVVSAAQLPAGAVRAADLSPTIFSARAALPRGAWPPPGADDGVAAARRSDYAVALAGLSDGAYEIVLRGAAQGTLDFDPTLPRIIALHDAYNQPLGDRVVRVVFVVARAPPVGRNVTLAPALATGAPAGALALPADLFAPSDVQPPAALALALAPGDVRGFVLARGGGAAAGAAGVRADNATLTTGVVAVAGPPGALTLVVRATNEVGATGDARVTLLLGAPPAPTLVAADARGVFNASALFTRPSAAGAIALTLRAKFSVAVAGATNASVRCTVGSAPCATLAVASFGVVSPAQPAGAYVFFWTLTLGGADVAYVLNAPTRSLNISLVSAGMVDVATGVATADSPVVRVFVDDSPPRPPLSLVLEQPTGTMGQYVAPLAAVVGVPYHVTLPYSLFDDDFSRSRNGGVIVTPVVGARMFGLNLVGGPLGAAYISGTCAAPLVAQRVLYALTATDLAGNAVSIPDVAQVVVLPSMPRGVPAITLSPAVANADLAFTEGGPPLAFDAGLGFAAPPRGDMSDQIEGVFVHLHSPEASPNGTDFAEAEYLAGADSCAGGCRVAYAIDILTGDGVLSLTPKRAETWVLGLPVYERAGNVTMRDVKDFLRSVRYVNTRRSIFSAASKRLIVAQVVQRVPNTLLANTEAPLAPFLDVVVASASRRLVVASANTAPAVLLDENRAAGAPPLVWAQAAPAPVRVLASLGNVTDDDDTRATAALVTVLANVTAWPGRAPCDSARDALSLDSAYRLADRAPLVYARWYAAPCALYLYPMPPLRAVPYADLIEALRAVAYTNLDAANPTAWVNATLLRRVSLVVTDDGAAGTVLAKTSEPVSVDLALRPAYAPYALDARAIYGAGGALSSRDPQAAPHFFSDARGFIAQRKWPLVLPAAGSAAARAGDAVTAASAGATCATVGVADAGGGVTCRLAIDLSPVAGRRGAFAGGAITSPNNAALPAAPPSVSFLVGGARAAGAVVGGTRVPLADAGATAALRDTFRGASFFFLPGGPSTLTLDLVGGAPAAALGEFTLELVFGDVAAQFAVDVRRAACTLADADNFVGAAALAAGTAYAANSGCAYAPVVVPADAGGAVTRGAFAADAAALGAAVAGMTAIGASLDAQFAALATLREAARGGFGVTVPPRAFVGAGSIALTAGLADAATAALLPAAAPAGAPAGAAARFDLSIAVKLGPPGTTFVAPFRVCLFVGSVGADETAALVIASQASALDETRGYGPFEFMGNASFNRATGQACGSASHFSVVAPLMLGLPPPPLAPRAAGQGAACPVDAAARPCAGAGVCREFGRCECFAGAAGADCSLRACPGGESWGQGEFLSDAARGGVAAAAAAAAGGLHAFAECSGRGVCNRDTGRCSCFAGFEGGACARLACPAAVVNATDTFVYVTAEGEAAAAAEVAWEAAFVAQDPALWAGRVVATVQPCSGRGRCRSLAELLPAGAPARAAAGAWALARVQRCVCDAGFAGADCSLRTCPVAADPAAAPACARAATRATQRLTIDFGQYPTIDGLLALPAAPLSLTVLSAGGEAERSETTARIADVWPGTPAAAAAIQAALRRVPQLAGRSAVDVAAVEATDAASLAVAYDVTVSEGDPFTFTCNANADGTLGCPAPGCQPRVEQLRLLSTSALPLGVALAPHVVLAQPPPVAGAAAGPATPFVWGAAATLALAAVPVTPERAAADAGVGVFTAPGGGLLLITYRWQDEKVYGAPLGAAEAAAATWARTATPLPPVALRGALAGPWGLAVSLGSDEELVGALAAAGGAGPRLFTFAWRLPACTVVTLAAPDDAPVTPRYECGRRGTCDTATGACTCLPGFEGRACGRAVDAA